MTIADVGSERMLQLDVRDRETGGLAAFETIQAHHASFCYWSLAAMYFMSLRNAYLPPLCKLPEGPFAGDPDPPMHCSNMVEFLGVIGKSLWYFVQSTFAGNPDFSILFFSYSNYNLFILGSLIHVILISSFFYLISARMLFVVESARMATRTSAADEVGRVGDPLARAIRRENAAVILVMLGGALSIVFLNLGPVLLLIVALFSGFAGVRRKKIVPRRFECHSHSQGQWLSRESTLPFSRQRRQSRPRNCGLYSRCAASYCLLSQGTHPVPGARVR